MKSLITTANLSDLKASGRDPSELEAFLPFKSREKLERITNEDNRLRSLLGEVLSRYTIGLATGQPFYTGDFSLTDKGKPVMGAPGDFHFNISHSGDLVACAVSQSEVGIDVEHVRKVNFRVAERFFSDEEKADLFSKPVSEQLEYFFTLWTIKESFLKAIGSGLTRNLNSFTVRNAGEGYILYGDPPAELYSVSTFVPEENYRMSVCSPEKDPRWKVQQVKAEEILVSLGIL